MQIPPDRKHPGSSTSFHTHTPATGEVEGAGILTLFYSLQSLATVHAQPCHRTSNNDHLEVGCPSLQTWHL